MSRLLISRSAIAHNLAQCLAFMQQSSPNPRLIAVLKDNAYGHGAELVGAFLRELGVKMIAVKNECEAKRLHGLFKDILILSQPARLASGGMGIYAINDIRDFEYLRSERLMLKIDSGMSRSGIKISQIAEAFRAAKAKNCTLLGAFTHFSSPQHIAAQQVVYAAALREYLRCAREENMLCAQADELASSELLRANLRSQIAVALSSQQPKTSHDFGVASHASESDSKSHDFGVAARSFSPGEFANTPGAFFHSAASFGLFAGASCLDGAARIGLALYGYAHPCLRPAARLEAVRISSRILTAGDVVGYDEKFRANRAQAASNYDLGYADGLAFYDGSFELWLDNAQILGKFSMDSFSAASTADELCVYDDAAVYADKFGISVYEALVRLSPNVPRFLVP